MRYPDAFDWHRCEAVRFSPEKLNGRATVGETRMDADGVLSNFESGLPEEEIIAFALARQMKAIA